MNLWKKKIIDTLISHYFTSASDEEEDRNCLRIRSSLFFPDFDSAHQEEKEAYLEAAETLERKKVVNLRWEKHGVGEVLRTISCENFEKLFREAGRSFPRDEAERTRAMLREKVQVLRKELFNIKGDTTQAKKVITLLEFLSHHFGLREIGQGFDQKIMGDLVKLMEFHFNPSKLEKITSRALSIHLYQDSKHLENLPAFCHHLFTRLQKTIEVPDISFMQRSFPETLISGKIIIEYKNFYKPLINESGQILGFPLESAEKIAFIEPVSALNKNSSGIRRILKRLFRNFFKNKNERSALIIENKETFYALATPHKTSANKHLQYDCFLYAGGYPNRAVVALIKILAASDFDLYYAGDMDPDGILIFQHVRDFAQQAAAGKPIIPVKMDAATFEKYLPWARNLSKAMLQQMERIREDTRAVPGFADLIQRIEKAGQGVEQEIVDYR